MLEVTKVKSKSEIETESREQLLFETDKAVRSVLYRVLMFQVYGVDVYDHKTNTNLHELIGYKDNSAKWFEAEKPNIYREPMNHEFEKIHNDFKSEYLDAGAYLMKMGVNQLYAVGKKIMAYDVLKGFTEELSDIVGRNNLERVYRLAQ